MSAKIKANLAVIYNLYTNFVGSFDLGNVGAWG
jgi:hypothetical protein